MFANGASTPRLALRCLGQGSKAPRVNAGVFGMATKRRAIIHIGTGKTGSTTIQALLAANRETIQAEGFAYPVTPGRRNHLKLAVYAADKRKAARMARTSRDGDEVAALARRFAAELGQELDALPASVHTVIFSNEHLTNKVASPESAARLRDLLAPHFDEFRIVVYFRRQDEYAVSLYSTRLRGGSTHEDMLGAMTAPTQAAQLDWAALLDRWGTAFGRAALTPRIFARDAFVDGDLVADFRAACGLGALPLAGEDEVRNPSILPAAQEFIRRLNLAASRGGAALPAAEDEMDDDMDEAEQEGGHDVGKIPHLVRTILDARFAGPGRRPSRADARAFTALFDASNERVRAEFFPGRPRLFSDDFSRYPEVADPIPSGEAVAEVAMTVILGQQVEADQLAADAAYRRGRGKHEEGDTAEAWRIYRRALAKLPTHVPTLRAMAEIATTPDLQLDLQILLRRAQEAEPDKPELRGVAQRLARAERGEAPVRRTAPTEAAPPARAARRPRAVDALPAAAAASAAAPAPAPAASLPAEASLSAEDRAARPKLSPEERAARRQARDERIARRKGPTAA